MDGNRVADTDIDWLAEERAYRAARRLEHPDGLTARAVCEGLAGRLLDAAEEDDPPDAAAAPRLTVVELNARGLVALTRQDWRAATALAREVTSRDHHDLVAQRIHDAAAEEIAELDTPLDAWLADRTCPAPFEELETRENGDVHFCCSAWQPVPIGKLEDGRAAWTSARAAEIRRSVLDGDFEHCSRWHCPRIADRRLKRRPSLPACPAVLAGPRRVILSHDRSCNLACPSCRKNKIMLDHAGTRRLDALVDVQLAGLIAEADTIKVTGSGDPFASRHFRTLISRLPRDPARPRRLQLHTNGLLFDQRAWEALDLWDQVSAVWISIDASRPETYAALRGGDFGLLMDNLHFLGLMRRAGALPWLRLDVVVQRDNYRELGEIVDLSARIGGDGVYLLRLRNWGTYSPAAFRALDVCNPDHPEHAAFLESLTDPRLTSPGVEHGSLAPLIAQARARRCDA